MLISKLRIQFPNDKKAEQAAAWPEFPLRPPHRSKLRNFKRLAFRHSNQRRWHVVCHHTQIMRQEPSHAEKFEEQSLMEQAQIAAKTETKIETESVKVGEMVVDVSGNGPAIVCVHGFTTTSNFWREQVEPFARHFRLIRPNLPGHGRSPHPAQRAYSIDAFVGDIETLFRHFSIDTAVLVGLSMGGTISQQFALRNSKRLRGLVLVGATPHGLGPDVNADNVIRAIDDVGIARASQNVIERSFGSTSPRALVDFAKQEVIQTPDFVARAAIRSLNESDSRERLRAISIPTLVVVGSEDIITPPSESEALAAGIPGAELAIIKSAGHFPMLERPSEFNQIFEAFLTRRCGYRIA